MRVHPALPDSQCKVFPTRCLKNTSRLGLDCHTPRGRNESAYALPRKSAQPRAPQNGGSGLTPHRKADSTRAPESNRIASTRGGRRPVANTGTSRSSPCCYDGELSDDSLPRRRLAAAALAGFCAFLSFYAPQPLLPMLAADFGVSVARISLVLTASTLAVATISPFAGMIADRWGRKRVIVPSAFLVAVPSALAAMSSSTGQLVFWRFLVGVFTPGISVVTAAYINEEWAEGVGSAVSAYVAGTILGGFSGRM